MAETDGANAHLPMRVGVAAVIEQDDREALRSAFQTLENPGLLARLADMLGRPVELIAGALPVAMSQEVTRAAVKAIEMALQVALRTMERSPQAAAPVFHRALVAASGAAGGAFGVAALPIELPLSTIIMLRSIADIARAEGEDLSDPDTALSCVQVFALGGRDRSTDDSESGYFAVRAVLATSVTDAARFIAKRGVTEEGAPILVRFITQVASRFGGVVTEKVAAQAVPLLGALGGAAVNYVFIEHFQSVAQAHFTVRRLERRYGKDAIRTEYDGFRKSRETDGGYAG